MTVRPAGRHAAVRRKRTLVLIREDRPIDAALKRFADRSGFRRLRTGPLRAPAGLRSQVLRTVLLPELRTAVTRQFPIRVTGDRCRCRCRSLIRRCSPEVGRCARLTRRTVLRDRPYSWLQTGRCRMYPAVLSRFPDLIRRNSAVRIRVWPYPKRLPKDLRQGPEKMSHRRHRHFEQKLLRLVFPRRPAVRELIRMLPNHR